MIYRIAAICLLPFLLIYKVNRVDFDKIKSIQRRILASTHSGWLEIILLGLVLYPQPIYYLGKIELFKNPLFGWLFRNLKCIPINRAKPGPSMIKEPMKILDKGGIIGIFPKGTRKQANSNKAGVVFIAQKCGASIIPVRYTGPGKFKLSHLWKRPKVSIRFFEPINCGVPEESIDRNQIMNKLSELLS